MSNRRIIWLTLFGVLCLVSCGLYRSLSVEPYPFKVSCVGDGTLAQLRCLVNQEKIVSKLMQFAKENGEDVTQWRSVFVFDGGKKWFCFVYDQDNDELVLWLNKKNGAIEEFINTKKFKKDQIETQKFLDEIETTLKEFDDRHKVDFLIQPLTY
jgi:hypothetical protein